MSCLQVTMMISGLRNTYTHTLHKLLLIAECSAHSHVRCECTPTFYLHAITISPHSLIKRIKNSYGTQRPTLNIAIILVIAYHLVANNFKDLTINPPLSINIYSPKDFIVIQKFKDDQFVMKMPNNFY